MRTFTQKPQEQFNASEEGLCQEVPDAAKIFTGFTVAQNFVIADRTHASRQDEEWQG